MQIIKKLFTRRRLFISLAILVAAMVSWFLVLKYRSSVSVAWFDDSWSYRQRIPVTNNTTAQTNVYISLTGSSAVDTSNTAKFQADCGDIRFTTESGELLKYSIVSGCGTSSTSIDVLLNSFPAGTQDIYMYYGNSLADNGFDTSSSGSTPSIDIQRNTADITNSGGTQTSPTNFTEFGSLSSAFVLNSNNRYMQGGSTSVATDMEVDDLSGLIELTAVGTITFSRESGSTTDSNRFAWESWEYIGAASGADEFIVRSRNTVSLSATESTTQTLDTTPTNIDNVIPFITGISCNSGTDDADCGTAVAWISGTNTLNIERGSGANNNVVVQVVSVEFTGSNWQVAHGDSGDNAADTGTITLVDNANGTTAGGGDITDWSTALIFHQYKANSANGVDDAIADNSAAYRPNANTNQVDWAFNANHDDSIGDGRHFVHVLKHPNLAVTRYTSTGSAQGANNVSITSAGLTDLSTSASVLSCTSSGTGTAYGRGWKNGRLTSLTNFEHWAHRSGNTIDCAIQIADLSQILVPGPAFSTEASNYTIGTLASEEIGPGPILYFSFDEGYSTTANDTSSSNADGTLAGTTTPSWKTEDMCVFGKCLYFEGTTARVTVADSLNVKTVSFWMRPMTDTTTVLQLTNSAYISISSGTLSATGFTSPSFYVDGVSSTSVVANRWQHVVVTTDTNISASSIIIGNNSTNFFDGFLDEIKLFSTQYSENQVRGDFATRGIGGASSVQFSDASLGQHLSDGLVGYWRINDAGIDTEGEVLTDSSGSKSNATLFGDDSTGDNGTGMDCTVGGKYGFGCTFDGVDDYVGVTPATGKTTFSSIKTVSFWAKPSSTTEDIINLSSTHSISISSGIVGASGFSNPIIYVDGKETSTFPDTNWHHVVITTDTAINADSFNIGKVGSSYYQGLIDDVRIYDRAFVSGEVSQLYNWAPSPVAYYDFNENTGTTAYDKTGNGNDGTLSNSPAWTSGKFGNSVDLVAASSQGVTKTDTADLSITSDLTVSAWIKPRVVTAATLFPIAGKISSGAASYLLAQYGDEIRMYIGSLDNYETTTASNLTAGNWYHVEATYNAAGQAVAIYINGVKETSSTTGTIPTSIADGTDDFGIGYNTGSGGSTTLSPVPAVAASGDDGFQATSGINGDITSTTIGIGSYNGNSVIAGFRFLSIAIPQGATITSATFSSTSAYTYDCGGCTLSAIVGLEDVDSAAVFTTTNGDISNRTMTTAQTTWDASAMTVDTAYPVDVTDAVQEVVNRGGWSTGNNMAVLVTDNGSDYAEWQEMYSWDHATGAPAELTITYSSGSSSNYYDGSIDEVKVYNYKRSSSQIIEDMNGGHPVGGSPVGSQVGYWKFDEGYGDTAYDSSSQSINGDLAGTAATCGAATYCPIRSGAGKYYSALSFADGQSGFVALPNDVYDTLTEGSISLWFKSDDAGDTTQNLFSATDGTLTYTNAFEINYIRSSDSIQIWSYYSSSEQLLATAPVSGSQTDWHHLTFTTDSSGHKLYIDGVLTNPSYSTGNATNTSFFDDVSTGTTYYRIGASKDNTTAMADEEFDGLIDEVKVYSAALTKDQVLTEYNAGKSLVLGAISTQSDGVTPSNSQDRSFCVPGDTATCDPPVAEWKMDENTGLVANDTSDNDYAGVFGASTAAPVWSLGKNGNGLFFDGSNDYVLVSDASSLMFQSGDFSASVWAKPTSFSGYSGLLTIDTSGDSGWKIFHDDGTSYYSARFYTTTLNYPSVSTNEWHHYYYVKSGTTLSLYLDGRLVNQTTVSATHNIAGTELLMGSYRINDGKAGAFMFSGYMDEPRIYDYARTPAQIAWDYNRGAPVAWYKMDECEGTTINNSAPAASGGDASYDGTLSLGASGTTAAGTCSTSGAWFNGASGKSNASMDYDGLDDESVITDTTGSIFDFASGETMTIAAWINPDALPSTGNYDTIFSKVGTSGRGYYAQIYSTGAMEFCIGEGSYDCFITSQTPVVAGTWQHVTYSMTVGSGATTMKAYYNGKLLSGTWNGSGGSVVPTLDNGSVFIGSSSASEYFEGKIDDVRLYRYALTQNQINTIMNFGAVSLN